MHLDKKQEQMDFWEIFQKHYIFLFVETIKYEQNLGT